MSSYSTQCHLCKTILQVRRRHRAAAAVARATWKVACSRLVPWCDVTLSAVLPPSRCCQLKGSASSVRAQKLLRQQHVNVAITCQLGQIFRTLFSLSSAACCFLSKFCHVRLTFCLMAREAAWLQISVRQCFLKDVETQLKVWKHNQEFSISKHRVAVWRKRIFCSWSLLTRDLKRWFDSMRLKWFLISRRRQCQGQCRDFNA